MKKIIILLLALTLFTVQIVFAQDGEKRQSRDAMFTSYLQKLQSTSIKVMSYEQLAQTATGYKVVVLGGYSGLGYEKPQLLQSYIKELLRTVGDHAMYVIGGTTDGIGGAYQWIPESARELGLKDIKTAGIVSRNAAEYGVATQDYIVFVDTAVDDWSVKVNGKSLMVNIAADSHGKMVYFKGGAVSGEEIAEALARSVSVILVNSPDVDPMAKNVAKKLAANPQYVVDGTWQFTKNPQQYPTLKVVSTPQF